MSSAGRSARGGDGADYFPTPPWVVWRLLDRHPEALTPHRAISALEPCAGDGSIVRAVDEHLRRTDRFLPDWTTVELRKGATPDLGTEHFEADYRTWVPPRWFQLVITNPPFALAESILRRALTQGDVVAFLLRVGFLGSSDRVPFWREFPDFGMRVVPDRISFDGKGSDSAYCAWFVWGASQIQGIEVLEPTSPEVRSHWAAESRKLVAGLVETVPQPSLF